MMRLTSIVVTCLLSGGVRASAELLSPDSSQAYNWDRGYPQACQCIETGVTNTDCSVFKCPCTCDLTAGSCDYNCCCDPDCSQEQIDQFENVNDFCVFSGSAPDEENLCYSANELQKVNPRSPMGGSSTTANAVDDLLCVTKVNKEYKGDFYDTPAWRTSSVFKNTEGQKDFDYGDDYFTVEADTSYDQNDTIPVFYNSSIKDEIISDGYLTIPIADFSGYCNDNNHARFQVTELDLMCRRHLDVEKGSVAFANRCERDLAATAYTSLLVASTPTDNLLNLRTLPVSVTSVQFASANESTSMLDITEAWFANDCATVFGNNESQNLNCRFSNDITDHADFFCFGAVKSVSFIIIHDQSSSSEIVNVSLQLVLTDVALSTTTSYMAQTFSVSYVNSPSATVVSANNGNQIPRYRSGNPGYVVGLPLLFGPIQSNVVNMSDQGLLVPSLVDMSSMLGDCLLGENVVSSPLIFGHDIFSGCTAKFNRSEIQRFCEAGSKPAFLSTTEGYVGYFGNADPLDTTQWFRLTAPPAGAVWQWNDVTSVCSAMTTGVNYKFLVGYAGEKMNPQHKIISATVDYTTQDFKLRVPANDEESVQAVVFSVSATFIFKNNQDLKGYTPPPPPGLLTVPYDVFYPFVGNTAVSHHSLTASQIVSSVLFCCIVYFYKY